MLCEYAVHMLVQKKFQICHRYDTKYGAYAEQESSRCLDVKFVSKWKNHAINRKALFTVLFKSLHVIVFSMLYGNKGVTESKKENTNWVSDSA